MLHVNNKLRVAGFLATMAFTIVACAKTEDKTTQNSAPTVPAEAGVCARWPASADTLDAGAHVGCKPVPTINFNGDNQCDGATEYGLVCSGPAPEGVPSENLGCRPLGNPGLSESCCPCRP